MIDEGADPALPGALQPPLVSTIVQPRQTLLGDRWAGDVAAQTLKSGAVAGSHVDGRVQLDSTGTADT